MHLLFLFFLRKMLKSVFLPRYVSKLSHDTNYLLTSEDTVEDPMMSVQFFVKSKSFFHFVLQSIYCFHFFLRKTLKSVFLPRYVLKLSHDTNYLLTSEDTVEDPLMSVQFYIKSKSFFSFRVTVHLLFPFFCKRRLNLYFYHDLF